MKIRRPRLLVASLVVALVVSVIGGYLLSRSGDDGDDLVVLDDPQDRTLPTDDLAIIPNGNVEGDPLPLATLSNRDGVEVTTASLLGDKPLVINMWFSTCAPCAKELPEFAIADEEFGDEIRFIGVNPIDSVPVMERFAGERGVTYDQLRDDRGDLTDGINAVNFPVTLFVTSDGTIVEQTGVVDADDLRDKIANLQAMEELV